MIFDKKLSERLNNYRWSENRNQRKINEEELNRIVMIMASVAESYTCSTSQGFTLCEEQLEKLLLEFYNAGFKKGEESVKRQIIFELKSSMSVVKEMSE